MNDMTVSEVSRDFGVSTRMLRYYEQEGLISSKRREDYAYRIYDENAVRRLRQILLLRKLRIPLKQIGIILNSADRSETVAILIDKIKELEEEISWVTIPDDMDVPAPLVKKQFSGGLYAVMTIRFPEFHRWGDLVKWAENNETYEPNYSPLGDEIMGGCLEEHLNWVYASHSGWPEDGIDGQLDLMLPIRKKGV